MCSPALCRGLAILTILGGLLSFAVAQGKKVETETVNGKVTSVEKKGRASLLKVEGEGGDALEIIVPGRLQFAVEAPGDKEFFRPNVWVSCENTVFNDANKLFFAKEFTVYLGVPVQAKAMKNEMNGWDLAGPVVAADEESITLRPNLKIMFDGEYTVSVRSNDPGLITEGAAVDVEGTRRGEKFLPQRVTVTLEEPLAAEDVFDAKGKAKKTAAKSKASKSAAGKSDSVDAGDPFGVKSGNKSAAKNADAPKTTDPFSKKPEGEPAPKAADPFKDKPKDK